MTEYHKSTKGQKGHGLGRPEQHLAAAVLYKCGQILSDCGEDEDKMAAQEIAAYLSPMKSALDLKKDVMYFRISETFNGEALVQFRVHEEAAQTAKKAYSAMVLCFQNEGGDEKEGCGPRTKRERKIAAKLAKLRSGKS